MKPFFAIFGLIFWAQTVQADVTQIGRFVWHEGAPGFGGMSGFHLDQNGVDFVAISDSGYSIKGQIMRDGEQIIDVRAGPLTPLLDGDGKPVVDKEADAEGLAVGLDGTVYVSFEGEDTRVWAYPDLTGPATPLLGHPDFYNMQTNGSLEALAIAPSGALYTFPERSGRANRPFSVYRFQGGLWTVPFSIPRKGAHLIVGADIGPDNRIYVLERDFTGIGFRTRVRRFAIDGSDARTLIDTSNATHDNLEGIAVWDDGVGLRITMIADDNFRFLQQTEIVEYRVTD